MNTVKQQRADLLQRARATNDTELIAFLETDADTAGRFRLPSEREQLIAQETTATAPQVDPLSGYFIHPDDMLHIHGGVWSRMNLKRFATLHGKNGPPLWPDTGAPMSVDDLKKIGVETTSAGQVITTAVRPGVGVGLGTGLLLGAALATRPYYYYGYPYGPYPAAPYGGGRGYYYGNPYIGDADYRYGYDPFEFEHHSDDDHDHRRHRRRSSSAERERRRTANRESRRAARNTRQTSNRKHSTTATTPVYDANLDDFGERLYSAGHAATTPHRHVVNDPLV